MASGYAGVENELFVVECPGGPARGEAAAA
jgi:hypothetical protein